MGKAISPQEASLEGLLEWTNSPVHLKDFAEEFGVPNLAKVIKGQYRDVGVAKSVQSELYIHAVQTSQKVLAEGVKVKEGKKVVISANQKYSLPLSYEGWFELLSQDGKAVKAITTIQELTRAFPASCIVREAIKGFVLRETGELTLDKYRTLTGGEQLKLVGEIWVTARTTKGMVERRLLHCMDINNEAVYFGMEQKGLFSPIAGQTNISGVHNLRGLLDKFRFPILVRLVHGIIPSKIEKNFTGVFRLNGVYSEESVFVCPLKKDAKMVPISTREPLKLVAASNFDDVVQTEGYEYHADRCERMITSYMNSIHLLFTMPDPTAVKAKKEEIEKAKAKPKEKVLMPVGSEEDILFEEVEDIYAYVREGGPAPPPPRPRPGPHQQIPRLSSVMTVAPPSGQQQRTSPVPPSDPASRKAGSSSPVIHKSDSPQIRKADSPVVLKSDSPHPDIPLDTPVQPQEKNRKIRRSDKVQSPVVAPVSPPLSPTLPVFTPTKDDFWEEPIYEPLDKIRRHKSSKKYEERIPAPVARSPAAEDTIVIPATPSPVPAQWQAQNPIQRRNTDVQNLRQVYKFSQENVSASLPRPRLRSEDDDELNDMLHDINAPPIPPKKFDNLETGDGEGPDFARIGSEKPEKNLEELEASGETRMTFDDEEGKPRQRSPSPDLQAQPPPDYDYDNTPPPVTVTTTTTTTVLHQSDIPVSPAGEPTVVVHTPTATAAAATLEHSRSYNQLNPTSTMTNVSYTQSHEMLSPVSMSIPATATASTYVYNTSLPPPVSSSTFNQNGYTTISTTQNHLTRTDPHTFVQKVQLNRSPTNSTHEVHVLNRYTNGSGSGSADFLHEGGAYATSSGGVVVHPARRTNSFTHRPHPHPHHQHRVGVGGGGGGGSIAPYSNDAPYVAVARVGDVVGTQGMRQEHKPFSRQQRKMQSMYL